MYLIKRYDTIDTTHLTDVMRMHAAAVEDALIQAGAKPGKDYTILDCFKLAQAYTLQWNEKKILDTNIQ